MLGDGHRLFIPAQAARTAEPPAWSRAAAGLGLVRHRRRIGPRLRRPEKADVAAGMLAMSASASLVRSPSRAARHRQRLLAIAGPEVDLAAVLRPWLKGRRLPASLRLHIDVDPYSFL